MGKRFSAEHGTNFEHTICHSWVVYPLQKYETKAAKNYKIGILTVLRKEGSSRQQLVVKK